MRGARMVEMDELDGADGGDGGDGDVWEDLVCGWDGWGPRVEEDGRGVRCRWVRTWIRIRMAEKGMDGWETKKKGGWEWEGGQTCRLGLECGDQGVVAGGGMQESRTEASVGQCHDSLARAAQGQC